MDNRRYVLISPCRDEARTLETTIAAIAAQTIKPTLWIIVDDGSTDDTAKILAKSAEKYRYITVVTRSNRGKRSVGPGVVDAFYSGLEQINLNDFDYVCKLDCDLDFGPRYFERCIERMERDRTLGTVSGKLYLSDGTEEHVDDAFSVGPVKFFRREAFEAIGGFVRQVSWDGIDCHMCRMLGWCAESVRDEELRITHLRRMGSSEQSFWEGRKRWGRGKYFMGSGALYTLAASVYRAFERPYGLSGLGIAVGYAEAFMSGSVRHNDKAYRKHLRNYELHTLIFGRSKTLEVYHNDIRDVATRPHDFAPTPFFPKNPS